MTDQARLLEETLGAEVEEFAQGGETRTFRLTGTDHLVTVPGGWPGERASAAEVARRATLLDRLAGRSSIPVPQVVRTAPEDGLLVVRRLPGERLIDAAPARWRSARRQVAATLGALLGELHTWDPAAYDGLVAVETYTPADWQAETAETAAGLAPALDESQQRDVRRFLSEPAPAPVASPVFSHNDLGIEHVLLSSGAGPAEVTGVIDWDDAAVCDPAYDFGLLLRDLGPEALAIALDAYTSAGGDRTGIAPRARFYARCTLLEDLAFGQAERRDEYVVKSVAAWGWTFRADHDD